MLNAFHSSQNMCKASFEKIIWIRHCLHPCLLCLRWATPITKWSKFLRVGWMLMLLCVFQRVNRQLFANMSGISTSELPTVTFPARDTRFPPLVSRSPNNSHTKTLRQRERRTDSQSLSGIVMVKPRERRLRTVKGTRLWVKHRTSTFAHTFSNPDGELDPNMWPWLRAYMWQCCVSSIQVAKKTPQKSMNSAPRLEKDYDHDWKAPMFTVIKLHPTIHLRH